MTPRLYDGAAGTALFLAAAATRDGGAHLEPLARAGFATVRDALTPSSARLLFEAGIGAGLGASSLLYALARAAECLRDEALLDAALVGAELMTPARIEADRRLDLLGGVAGTAVALLTLARLRPSDRLLDQATACGRQLLAHRKAGSEGAPRAWATLGGAVLSGLSHGAAGIVLALERLHAATGERAFLDAAEEGRAWEDGTYSEEARNWPDFRYPVTARSAVYQSSWCHGAPGIGLARLGRPGGPDAVGLHTLERALAFTLAEPPSPIDHLCCGELGRVELLLEAGRRLARPGLVVEARRRVSAVVARARSGGRYALGFGSELDVASFHQGTAGIGWALLRLSDPSLPSVLLWE
jgi:lantibiotic modifying enzyme